LDVAAAFRKAREQEKDPKIQSIRLASHRAQLLATHGVLFRKLGLTPSEIERFQDIAARKEEQNLDLDGILESEAQQNGAVSPETKRAVEKLREQVKSEAETARKELLGEERSKALEEYNRTAETRRLVGDVAGAAAVAGIPLTPEQAEQLTKVLANASDGYPQGGAAAPWKIDWKRADEQARGILSAPQMQYFQTTASPLSYFNRFYSRLGEAMATIAKTDAEHALATTEKGKGG
jgi:DNA repair exonuclease SbcCD ATPase subunit